MKNTRRRAGYPKYKGGRSQGRGRGRSRGRGRGRGRSRGRRGGLSPLSPASFSSSGSAKSADISGHFGAIVPGGPGHQGALPTGAHELSQASMNALQVGANPSGDTAVMDPLRPKPFGGQMLPDAFY